MAGVTDNGVTPFGASMKPWSPRSVSYLVGLRYLGPENEGPQGHAVCSVAELVDRIPSDLNPDQQGLLPTRDYQPSEPMRTPTQKP